MLDEVAKLINEHVRSVAEGLQEVSLLAEECFGGDDGYVRSWIGRSNSVFGNAAPVDLIVQGRGDEVMSYLKGIKQYGR